MKKYLMLTPVMALSLACFTLAGCDDKAEENAAVPAAETTAAPETDAAAAVEEKQAASQEAGLIVSDAYSYATTSGAGAGAIFAKIANAGSAPDFLLSAKVDPSVANAVEIHQTYEDPQTGATLMRKTSGIDIGANRDTMLEPTGYHIMLLGLAAPLTSGMTFTVTLSFRHAGDIVVPVTVVTVGARELQGESAMQHEGMDHDSMIMPDEQPVQDDHDHAE